jgi:AcrR family transcriptional regulator
MTASTQAAPAGRVARRRAEVREKLLCAAQDLMRERGVDGVTIEDITEAADIARRTFYHHFDGKHAILIPIARQRSEALNARLDRLAASLADPAEGMATAMRHALRQIPSDPLCRWFVLHSGLPVDRLHEGFGHSAMRDVRRAVEAGRFHVSNTEVVRQLVSGAFIAILTACVEGRLHERDIDDAVEHVLRLLGLDRAEAHRIAHVRLRPLPGGAAPR